MVPYYEHGGITIYHGDCRDVLPLIGAVDCVLTDPPYGAGYAGDTINHTYKIKTWDNEPITDLIKIVDRAPVQIVWGGNYYALPPSRGWLVWRKLGAVPSMADVELAWTNQDMNARHIEHSISATQKERVGHPTQKPLRVMRWSIQQIKLAPNSVVLDPFMGSGTTLRAAKDMGHRAIGIEIDERYCEVAAKRLSQEVMELV